MMKRSTDDDDDDEDDDDDDDDDDDHAGDRQDNNAGGPRLPDKEDGGRAIGGDGKVLRPRFGQEPVRDEKVYG